MHWIRNLSWLQLIGLLMVPLTAYAISWSMGSHSAPTFFRQAAQSLGLRVTQVCRPNNANYGAQGSLHKRCLAMDIGKETPRSKIAELKKYGLCGQFHKAGYYGATGDHWHVVQCSTPKSQAVARKDQRTRAQSIRSENKVKTSQRSRSSEMRRRNEYEAPRSRVRSRDDDWAARAFGIQ